MKKKKIIPNKFRNFEENLTMNLNMKYITKVRNLTGEQLSEHTYFS